MLTFILAILSGAVLGYCGKVFFQTAWAYVPMTIAGFLVVIVPINLWLKKRLEAVFYGVQGMIQQNQMKLQRQVQQMQGRMMGSPKGLQKRLEKDQATVIRNAIKELDAVKPMQKWNLMAKKQANTLKAQLHYQIHEFEKAEKYFKNSLAADPLTVAMQMALKYKHDDMDGLDSMYRKYRKKFKGDQGTIIHALYSWALVKKNRAEQALETLVDATEKSDDPVLKSNWEHLANGRTKSFSNAALGDMWYALHLEEPKAGRVKQRSGRKRR